MRAKRLMRGRWFYRNCVIQRHDGRGVSRWRWVWEIIGPDGSVWGHYPTLWRCKMDIDDYIDLCEAQKDDGSEDEAEGM